MKKHIKLLTIGTLLLGGLTGCNDFLDREPLDKVIPEKYFASESDLAAYTINAYPFETVTDAYGINFFGKDNDTDNQASGDSPAFWIPGQKKVPSGEGEWDWSKIRTCNYFFDNTLPKFEAGTITGNQDNVKHYIGEMYVIRAYNYYKLLVSLGDLPIITTALPDVEETLVESSKRQPRNKVARFILDDLQKATELLLDKSPGGKNRISKNVAHLLRARVALFEATWEKYHKGTAFVPGGKGWPGNPADVSGFNSDTEVAYFLDEAMKSSKVVGDYIVGKLADNTDTPEGMNASLVSINPYYTMFCDENMEGYDEILMWKQFKEGLVTSNLQMELERNGGGSGWTRGMVNSFLMRNGLPIYAAGSGSSFFRFLFQSGEEGLFHGLPAGGCHHAALCKKGSAAAIQYYRCVLIDLLFADRAQKPNRHQGEDVALPGGQRSKYILLYLHGRQQRMVVADL